MLPRGRGLFEGSGGLLGSAVGLGVLVLVAWVLAGALLQPPVDSGSRPAQEAQEGSLQEGANPSEVSGEAPEPGVEIRNIPDYGSYQSKDPFRELIPIRQEPEEPEAEPSSTPQAPAESESTAEPGSPDQASEDEFDEEFDEEFGSGSGFDDSFAGEGDARTGDLERSDPGPSGASGRSPDGPIDYGTSELENSGRLGSGDNSGRADTGREDRSAEDRPAEVRSGDRLYDSGGEPPPGPPGLGPSEPGPSVDGGPGGIK